MTNNDNHASNADEVIQYVTVVIGGQLFGLPISQVHDVFVPERVTRVPLAAPQVAGVLNLRGRIVTAELQHEWMLRMIVREATQRIREHVARLFHLRPEDGLTAEQSK